MNDNDPIVQMITLSSAGLGVLFVGLKLTEHIDWDWWLVVLPFAAPFILAWVILRVLD